MQTVSYDPEGKARNSHDTLSALAALLKSKSTDPDWFAVSTGGEVAETIEEPGEVHESKVVEDGPLIRPICLPAVPETRFEYFSDGTQSPRLLGFQGVFPVYFSHNAAAVLHRDLQGNLSIADLLSEERVFLPYPVIDPTEYQKAGILTLDTSRHVQKLSPSGYAQAARRTLQIHRESLEKRLACRWWERHGTEGSWLAVDGRLDLKCPRAVGLIKSHAAQYLTTDQLLKVWRMGVGERSAAFLANSGGIAAVSWYVRMHNPRPSPTWGLVRLEIAHSPDALGCVDSISSWLFAERAPISGDPRWHRMIYAIWRVEEQLKSLAPSHVSMEALGL
jgi:hypothetical protein